MFELRGANVHLSYRHIQGILFQASFRPPTEFVEVAAVLLEKMEHIFFMHRTILLRAKSPYLHCFRPVVPYLSDKIVAANFSSAVNSEISRNTNIYIFVHAAHPTKKMICCQWTCINSVKIVPFNVVPSPKHTIGAFFLRSKNARLTANFRIFFPFFKFFSSSMVYLSLLRSKLLVDLCK